MLLSIILNLFSWREVDLRAVQGCQWTDWMKTKCTAAGVNVRFFKNYVHWSAFLLQ